MKREDNECKRAGNRRWQNASPAPGENKVGGRNGPGHNCKRTNGESLAPREKFARGKKIKKLQGYKIEDVLNLWGAVRQTLPYGKTALPGRLHYDFKMGCSEAPHGKLDLRFKPAAETSCAACTTGLV